MSVLILNGKTVRDSALIELKIKVQQFSHTSTHPPARSRVPTLAIVQVGNRPDSTSYIKAKKTFAKKIGVEVEHIHLLANTPQTKIIEAINDLNSDKTVNGIIVQLPLPEGIERDTVIDAIDPRKDADGLTSYNIEQRFKGGILPATARGVRELLAHYKITLNGKKVVVIGRSALVGKPIADMCEAGGAHVTVCHSKTPDLKTETQKADIIIVAVGKPGLITREHVKKGQVIIDVGITKSGEVGVVGELAESGKSSIVGDVDFEVVKNIVSAISPVPGGVGPMTVLALFENVIELVK